VAEEKKEKNGCFIYLAFLWVWFTLVKRRDPLLVLPFIVVVWVLGRIGMVTIRSVAALFKMENRAAVRVAIWGGGGAAFGITLFRTVFGDNHDATPIWVWGSEEWRPFVLAVSVVLICRHVIEPLLDQRLRGESTLGHHHAPAGERTFKSLLSTFCFAVVVETIVELECKGVDKSAEGFLFALLGGLLTCGVITYAWVRGAQHRPTRVLRNGVLGGLLAGGLTVIVVLISALILGDIPRALASSFQDLLY